MASAVLIVASTRVHVDPQEILRIQDTVAALREQARAVDILVPRKAALLTATLDPSARVFVVPPVPFSDAPPDRPSLRRFIAAASMAFRGLSLAARRDYAVIHGFNDGAIVAKAIAGLSVSRRPYIAEILSPFSSPRFFKSPRRAIACRLERRALAHAAAIILPDESTLARFRRQKIPVGRVSVLPDPHTGFVPDSFTLGDYRYALEHIYAYVLRPRP
ncbi:MAG: glycosyltransferase [Kiritimatiellia bacterium]